MPGGVSIRRVAYRVAGNVIAGFLYLLFVVAGSK